MASGYYPIASRINTDTLDLFQTKNTTSSRVGEAKLSEIENSLCNGRRQNVVQGKFHYRIEIDED